MKRRNFLKLLAISGISPNITIDITAKFKEKPWEWFNRNEIWLKAWLNNWKFVMDYKGMQIFKRSVPNQYDYWKLGQQKAFDESIKMNLHLMKRDILLTSVFGIGKEETIGMRICINPEDEPKDQVFETVENPIRQMSGFIEQKDRYPTPKDKVSYEALSERWFKYYLGGNCIVTECRLCLE